MIDMKKIPGWATGRFMVAMISLSTIVSRVPLRQRLMHLELNRMGWKIYRSKYKNEKYIEHQAALTDMVYGKKNFLSKYMVSTQISGSTIKASANACEVISVYNALISFADENQIISFPELLCVFEEKGAVLGGNGGGSLSFMRKTLENHGRDAKLYIVKKLKDPDYDRLQKEYKSFIISTWNRDNITDGLHSMCITLEDDLYRLHNAYGKGVKSKSLKEVVYSYSQNPIALIAVR